MSIGSPKEGASEEYSKLSAFLKAAEAAEGDEDSGHAVGSSKHYDSKQCSFGYVQVNQMGDHIEVQVQHDDNEWSEFKIDEEGLLSSDAKHGLTLEKVLGEL